MSLIDPLIDRGVQAVMQVMEEEGILRQDPVNQTFETRAGKWDAIVFRARLDRVLGRQSRG